MSTSPSSSMSFPIVIVAVVGIFGTATFLLVYYVFIIKCCLNIHVSEHDHIFRRLSHSRRRLQRQFSFAGAVPERQRGLDQSVIRAIPIFRYSSAVSPSSGFECAVCLVEFREDERLRRLGGCGHGFHVDCIDTWLESNASCPLCRSEVTKAAEEEGVVVEMVGKRAGKKGSMGDECVEVRREKDEIFVVGAMRRSLSMDSSGERKVVEAVRAALRRNSGVLFGDEEGGNEAGGRREGLFVAFGGWRSGRNSRRAVQPVPMEV